MSREKPESRITFVLLWVATVGGPLVVAVAFLYGFAMLMVSWLFATYK